MPRRTPIRFAVAAWAALIAVACAGPSTPAPPLVNYLLTPRAPEINEQAPDTFRAVFETTKGEFVVEVPRDWAPIGADRFYNLVRHRFFEDIAFFRVIDGFMAQFGVSGDTLVNAAWQLQSLRDDPVTHGNARGTITFGTTGRPNSRVTQLFINTVDNRPLDRMGFAPIGRIVEGMEVVDSLYSGYGEGAPRGNGPIQSRIRNEGNAYLRAEFPELDYVIRARIVGGP